MDAIMIGFSALFADPMNLVVLVFGIFLGIVFGCIPGLTATLGVTLMIPFTYTMTPIAGLTLLIAIYVGGISGGLITATLINIPGTPSSIFTCYDGYPMAKSGKPGEALSIGVFASLVGQRVVLAGRSLRGLLPAVGQQPGILLAREDRVERPLDDDHLGLLELGDDLRGIGVLA